MQILTEYLDEFKTSRSPNFMLSIDLTMTYMNIGPKQIPEDDYKATMLLFCAYKP
jgi:hypothetical protein